MMKKVSKITVFLLLSLIVFSSNSAFAASGDIFTIISNKMVSTIQDVRKIVYVIAGFGLIMFAVLAIFNKISFKHLAYIMIGLSLLSLMMPFINYFSGAELSDSEYSYENFIAGGDASIIGSDVESQEDCTLALCPEDTGDSEDSSDEVKDLIDESGIGDLNEENSDTTTEYDSKSFKQTFKDTVNTTKNVVAAAQNVVGAVNSGINAVDAVKDGISGVNSIISSDGNILDKLGSLASLIGSTSTNVAGNIGGATSYLGNALGNSGTAGDIATGSNNVSGAIEDSGVGDVLDSIRDGVSDASSDVVDYTSGTQDLADYGNSAIGVGNSIGDWFNSN